jgi:Fe-S-cluster containining protein
MNLDDILKRYSELLAGVDSWFARCQTAFPGEVRCGKGCSGCCRGLFDITLLDAWYLKVGFSRLPDEVRRVVRERAGHRLEGLKSIWPELSPPFMLNCRPEEDWELLMPDDDESPCVLLGDDGRCLVYEYRPMTCRLHGLPLIDLDGTVMHDEWCTENFTDRSPLEVTELRAGFTAMFREEVSLFRMLESLLLKQGIRELDTFIPLAVLMDFERFDWKEWGRGFKTAGEGTDGG